MCVQDGCARLQRLLKVLLHIFSLPKELTDSTRSLLDFKKFLQQKFEPYRRVASCITMSSKDQFQVISLLRFLYGSEGSGNVQYEHVSEEYSLRANCKLIGNVFNCGQIILDPHVALKTLTADGVLNILYPIDDFKQVTGIQAESYIVAQLVRNFVNLSSK